MMFLSYKNDKLSEVNYGKPKSKDDWPEIKEYNIDFRHELHVMHTAITRLGLWKEFAKDPDEGGFMFSMDSHVIKLSEDPEVDKCGHSAATAGFAMRIMQSIAINGWEEFCNSVNTAKDNPKPKVKVN